MSDWYWRVIALKTAFVLTCLTSYLRADDTIQKLPYCNPHAANDGSAADLVIVSTLDGHLTAFTASNGVKAWEISTQPLLSSNLHHVELSSGGKWVRIVPSLRGALYSLSGETVEPLPFDAEQLLSSSFKYSEDVVIAGSREAVWLGVDPKTGTVLYECGSLGCHAEQDTTGRSLLVVRRQSSTVRAVDPRSGRENWNFSVGEHHVTVSGRGECVGGNNAGPPGQDYAVRVALPEGTLAVSQPHSQLVLWQRKLEAPVASMWRLRGTSLQNIDVLWAAAKTLSSDKHVQVTPPSIYVGLHNQQLYIQEGQLYVSQLSTAVASKAVPWSLKISRPLLAGPGGDVTSLQSAESNSLSLLTLYGNGKRGDQGFFLYKDDTCDQSVQVTEEELNDTPDIYFPDDTVDETDHHHIHVHVSSLWFWWKEVLLIAVSSALLMNLMIWPRFFAPKTVLVHAPSRQVTRVVHIDSPPVPVTPEYSGRYENDFTPLRCLGRGGFGVVFEAKNNIDHCSYAVKRITLPRRESKRERVLREVRALAKLEHEHIVRYFNAWLEEPPALWQEERDAIWMRELDGVSVAMTEECTTPKSSSIVSPALPSKTPPGSDSVMLNLQKFNPLELLELEPSKRLRSLSCSDSHSIIFDENASTATNKSKHSLKNSLNITSDLSLPANLSLSKNLGSGDNDDSFIVFANTEDFNHNSKGLSEARNDSSYKKQLALPSACNQASSISKKKGHTRHWSLDLCVKSTTEDVKATTGSKMYLYIQMQLCRRDSLHDWLRQNRTYEARREQVTTLFSQIVSAVEYVHLAGLIHRDLKPSNIFFAPDGKVKVGDFGLVTAMTDSSQDGEDQPQEFQFHTRHTYRVGTHLYMSPEQLRGRPYSYKVDIYSLGLILFELLQPFGTEAERISCLLNLREGRYPNAFQRNYPKEMEVLKLMLSSDPSRRPTASGVKARAPLYENTDERWHFTLPSGTP